MQIAFDAVPTGMLLVDHSGRVALANGAASRLLGWSRSELMGQPVEMLVPARHAQAHVVQREALHATDGLRRMAAGREVPCLHRDGHECLLEITLTAVDSDDGPFTLVTLADPSPRLALERAAAARVTMHRLLEAEDRQRRRIARDIHDALGQSLTALSLDVGWLAQQLAPLEHPALHERMQAMAALVAASTEEVRRVCAELRPAVLDEQGLVAAVRWLVGDFAKRSGLRCTLALPALDVDWDAERRTVAFRVLQEALTNVSRHSGAGRVGVSLRQQDDGMAVLQVSDDGRGFGDEQRHRLGALGLGGMHERALFHGGSVQVVGTPGQGTTVTLSMPTGPMMPLAGAPS